MSNNLILIHRGSVANKDISRFQVIFPNNIGKLPKFVKVGKDKTFAILKVSVRNVDGAVYVTEGTLKEITDNTQIGWKRKGFISFNWYKIRHDTASLIAFLALFLAIAGTAIDGSFAIGKSGTVWFHLTTKEIAFYLGLALTLKIVGLLILFAKSLMDPN